MRDSDQLETRLVDEQALQSVESELAECRQRENILERYRLLFRYARDIILFVRPDGSIIEANDAALDAYGYTREELLSLNIYDLRAPETQPKVRRQMDRADEQGILFETVHRRKDGSAFPVEVSSLGADIAGERVLLSIIRDITERKRAEEALRDSEERFRAVTSAAFEGIIIHEGGRVLEVNDAAARMFGFEPSELIGKTPVDLVAPESREAVRKHIAEASREPYEIIARRKNGTTFIAEVRGRKVTYKGRTARATAIRDITERKRADRALEEERARLQAVLSSLPVAVWIADEKGAVVQTNEAVERIWGGSPTPDEIGGYAEYKGWWANTGKPIEAEDWALARAVTKGEVSTGEVIDVQRFDGMRGTILNNAAPVRDQEGRIIGGVAVALDITDLRVAEEELSRERELLQAIIDNIPVYLVIWNQRLQKFRFNEAFRRDMGWTEEDAAEGDFMAKVYPDTEYRREVEEYMRSLTSGFRDLKTMSRDGKPVDIAWANVELSGDRSIGIGVNITERKRTEEALRRERERITAMESVASVGIETLEYRDLLDHLAERISNALNTHSCTIFVLDEETNEFVAEAAYNLPEECGFRIGARTGFVGKINKTRRTIYVADAENDPLVVNPYIKRTKVKSILGTPLIARGKLVGVVYVNMMEIRKYSPEEIRLFEQLADRTALIVDNAVLRNELARSRKEMEATLERETHFSRLLQRALLPTIPEKVDGYTLGSMYIPAYAEREVGGDFFDVFSTEDGRLCILVGDVSGKGLESASFAASTRSTVRAFAYERPSPAEVLTHANAVLSTGKDDLTLFVTVFLVIIDTRTGELRYAGAGHPPAAVYHVGSDVEFLTYGNPPLGLFSNLSYSEASSRISPGDKLVLYTDGITEARYDTILFGTEGIERIMEEHGDLSPYNLAGELVSAAGEWAHGHLTDDIAVLVVERCPGT